MSPRFLLAVADVPFAQMITQAADSWLLGKSGLFLAEGTSWVTWIGKIVIGIAAGRFFLEIAGGGTGEGAIAPACYRLLRWLVVLWMLRYYNTPADVLGGLSVHNLIPEAARQLLISVTDNSLKEATQSVEDMQDQADQGNAWWDVGEDIAATILNIEVSAFNGIMILLSCGGYVLMAIAVTVGPLSIPWLAFESTSWLFWDWLQVLISSSMYQVIAAVLVNIWCNVVIQAANFESGLSIVELSLLFGALTIAIFLSCIGIGWITNALYGKGASSAANLAQTTVASTVAVVSRL